MAVYSGTPQNGGGASRQVGIPSSSKLCIPLCDFWKVCCYLYFYPCMAKNVRPWKNHGTTANAVICKLRSRPGRGWSYAVVVQCVLPQHVLVIFSRFVLSFLDLYHCFHSSRSGSVPSCSHPNPILALHRKLSNGSFKLAHKGLECSAGTHLFITAYHLLSDQLF